MEQHVKHVKKSFGFLKTTAIGGLIFLLPLIVIGILVGEIAPIVLAIAKVLSNSSYIDTDKPADVALLLALSIAIVVLMCFLAGMIARWSIGQKLSRFMEKNLIILFPRYAIYREQLKGSIGGEHNKPELIPVLVRFDDVTRLAFEAERTEGSLVSIFLPGSPDPWTGNVIFMSPDRVERLDIPFSEALGICERMGRESLHFLEQPPQPLTEN
ncbi:DUF502 domain-containing protein [Gimesia chilikensis]|uniref:DUF502 domain-containing protein n=1 Tax=Gimesia chilikensis TaxID=2605989 RepID=UPI0011EED743|nr:DUF502 domain-containing protein [Gimesia chilikensis]KAA0134532.1 DUF502 domain-containing protein [Gimesia chilikensis]